MIVGDKPLKMTLPKILDKLSSNMQTVFMKLVWRSDCVRLLNPNYLPIPQDTAEHGDSFGMVWNVAEMFLNLLTTALFGPEFFLHLGFEQRNGSLGATHHKGWTETETYDINVTNVQS